jgi:hypothetical protein
MPSLPKGKRVRTNDHPGLIGKQGHRSKAEVAAEKVAKVAKVTIATATEQRVLTELAELELEQEKMDTAQREVIIHRRPATKASTDTPGEDSLQADINTSEDLTELIDEEMEKFDNSDDESDEDDDETDEDDDELGAKKGVTKKVSYTSLR